MKQLLERCREWLNDEDPEDYSEYGQELLQQLLADLDKAIAEYGEIEVLIDNQFVMECEDDQGNPYEDGYFVMSDELCSNPMNKNEAGLYARSLDGKVLRYKAGE